MNNILSLNAGFFGLNTIQLLTACVLVAGLIILIGSMALGEKNKEVKNSLKHFFHDFLRDVGIAFWVAAIVTIVYGGVLDFERFSDAVGMMIGEDVPQSVWDKTKTQVFRRDVLRGNYEAMWQIIPDKSLPSGQVILKVKVKYTIYGLKPQPFDYEVEQELENMHLYNTDKKLPRFDKVTVVGVKVYEGAELDQLVKNGYLRLPKIPLNAWKKTDPAYELQSNNGTDIIFERSEIINVPGEYNTVFSGLTKDVRLQIDPADDIQFGLKEAFDANSKGFEKTGNFYIYKGIVLPGQCLSVQFWHKNGSQPAKR